ncbi:hypothetical protein GQ55_2G440700 [Panicum hallii var. hallii]|uniref:Uncharacterized protein n=1 Tax=Panicum hallii var. hallii TaxID=1504633 RepID=A0A2T7EYW5_9POAL|nr:hypothetical protein GQ55_2G440700 [Panicum hallii var. hallii]
MERKGANAGRVEREARPADLARHVAPVAWGALPDQVISDHRQPNVAVGAACYAARAQLDRHRNACRFWCDAGIVPPFDPWHDMNPAEC